MTRAGAAPFAEPSDDRSLWLATSPDTRWTPLDRDVRTDVVVLGGGVAGMTTALMLQRDGRDVVLLEADRIGGGTTGRSTVKVSATHGTRYSEIRERHGAEAVRAYGLANLAGLELVATMVDELGIDCGFERRRNLVYATEEEQLRTLERELAAHRMAGLPSTIDPAPNLPFGVAGALVTDEQAQFHPVRYLHGLARAFEAAGGRVIEGTRARDVDEGDPRVVETERGTVRATDVVVATHHPIADTGMFFARMAPYREYAIAGPATEDQTALEMALSVGEPLHSARSAVVDGVPYVVIVGNQEKVGHGANDSSVWGELEAWARATLGLESVMYRWTAHDLMTIDGLPYVGRMPGTSHVWTLTGFGAWGMTNASAGALVVRDAIAGEDNPWAALYAPDRGDLR